MDNFYSLTKEEENLIKETTTDNYIPAIVIRSQFREQHFGHQLKGILSALKYDFEQYGNIRVEWINQEREYDFKYFPKYITVIYLTPEANEIFLKNRWYIFKLKRINKWNDEQIQLLFRNENGIYYDAMTLPVGVVDREKTKSVCDFVERKFPEVNAKATYKNHKALIHCSIEDINTAKHANKRRLQALIAQAINENYFTPCLNCNGVEIDEIIVPEKPSKKKKVKVDPLER